MIAPLIPENEEERLSDLESYEILDTLPEEAYDDLTKLAAQICGTSISLITLLDTKRQWFKSHYGFEQSETPREYAFCAHAILDSDKVMIVPDSRKDERFHDNPLVTGEPNVVFYSGVPLVSPQGYPWGTLCVIDMEPKEINSEQIESLKAIAKQVIRLFEFRKSEMALMKSKDELLRKNRDLEIFASTAAHDISSPLSNIISLTELLTARYSSNLDAKGLEIVDLIRNSSFELNDLIKGILSHSRSEELLKTGKETIELTGFLKDIFKHFTHEQSTIFRVNIEPRLVKVNTTALKQIFINLISNALKYNESESKIIEIVFLPSDKFYHFSVKDNGIGITPDESERIFDLFQTGGGNKLHEKGSGIGLSTVKKLVNGMGGTIEVYSGEDGGATFSFTIAK